MPPMRDFGGGALGIRFDPRTWATRLTIVSFVLSVLVMGAHHLPDLLQVAIYKGFIFSPADARHGELWQVATFGFIEVDPLGLLFSAYCMLVFGADIEDRLGSRSFLAWFFGLSVAAGLATLGLSFVWRRVLEEGQYTGASAVGLGLLVVWAALHRGAIINFMMVLPMSAELLVWLSLGLLILYSIRGHPVQFIPDYAAFAVAEIATRQRLDLSPRRAYLRYRAWAIERALRKKSRHFTVIPGGGQDRDRDEKPNKNYLN